MVSNKRSLYIASAVLAVFVLIFLSSALVGQAVSPVEIKFWHAMGRSRGKVLTELVERFNRENPNIIVKAEYVKSANEQYGNDYNALYAKILENIAKDTPPDVAQVYENWTTQYISIDSLVPIQDLMSPEDLQKANKDLIPVFLEANTFTDASGEKKLYTLPFNKSIYVLFYNDKIFKELGLNPPTTWNELRNVAKIISTKKGIPGLAFQPSVDIFGHYLYSYGGTYISNNKAVFGGKLGVDDLNYWNDLVHKDMSAKPTFEAAKMFEKGQAAMYIETTSKIGGFEKARKDGLSFGVLPIPKGTTQSYQFAGTNLAIF
ncbi:extracellular solute-binding protein, partial [bacterium]|nr:extracellular solute-binding protein [bacterium]